MDLETERHRGDESVSSQHPRQHTVRPEQSNLSLSISSPTQRTEKWKDEPARRERVNDYDTLSVSSFDSFLSLVESDDGYDELETSLQKTKPPHATGKHLGRSASFRGYSSPRKSSLQESFSSLCSLSPGKVFRKGSETQMDQNSLKDSIRNALSFRNLENDPEAALSESKAEMLHEQGGKCVAWVQVKLLLTLGVLISLAGIYAFVRKLP